MMIMGLTLIIPVAAIYWLANVLDVRHYLNFIIVVIFYYYNNNKFANNWSLSHVQLFMSPWIAASQAPLSPAVSQSLLKFMSIESVMLS